MEWLELTWYMVLGRRKSDMLLMTSSLEDSLSGSVLTLPCMSKRSGDPIWTHDCNEQIRWNPHAE